MVAKFWPPIWAGPGTTEVQLAGDRLVVDSRTNVGEATGQEILQGIVLHERLQHGRTHDIDRIGQPKISDAIIGAQDEIGGGLRDGDIADPGALNKTGRDRRLNRHTVGGT